MLRADGLLPDDVTADLLRRWSEQHRRYHALPHLADGLAVLELLGGGRLDRIAFWFHDAVHTSSSPADEEASAALARVLLVGRLPAPDLDEVCRLILVTVDHLPPAGDEAAARLSDADLHGLAAPWPTYLGNLAAIRAERPDLRPDEWNERRRAFVGRMLDRATLFRTARGLELWERQARANLGREWVKLSASS